MYDVGETRNADDRLCLLREDPSIPEYSLQLHQMPLRHTVLKLARVVVRYFPGVMDFLRDFVHLADRHAEL